MTQQEYEQKKRECWEEFRQLDRKSPYSLREVNAFAFDRGYALGKQEKDAKPNNTIKARRKSDGEIIEVREWRGASDVIYSSPDMNQFYQASELDFNLGADTVIQGWVARDEVAIRPALYTSKPLRQKKGFKNGYWSYGMQIGLALDPSLFPDLTWESDPLEVELIIKRKKK